MPHKKIIITLALLAFLGVGASVYQYNKSIQGKISQQREVATTTPSTESGGIKEDALVGVWELSLVEDPSDPQCKEVKDENVLCIPNDSQELDFSSDAGLNVFSSFLHHRPELSGCVWHVQRDVIDWSCNPEVNSSNLSGTFKILSLSSTTLRIET